MKNISPDEFQVILRAAWLKALRSGEYKQGYGLARTTSDRYCCLGVLCDVFQKMTGKGKWENIHDHWESHEKPIVFSLDDDVSQSLYPPAVILQRYVGATIGADTLIQMNDVEKCSFDEIADYIENL